jgi:anti-sigma B factor antagonist
MNLKIDVATREDCVFMTLAGDLTSESAPRLRQLATELEEASSTELPVLALNFLEITYIDSAGLGTLVSLHKSWQERGKPLILSSLSPLAKKFLRTTGLLRVFHVVESEEQISALIERANQTSLEQT